MKQKWAEKNWAEFYMKYIDWYIYEIVNKMHWAAHHMVFRKKYSQFSRIFQRYTYRVLQTIQMKVILLSVWAEGAVLGRAKTALKFKYEI